MEDDDTPTDSPKRILKKLCCTCLSYDRKLFQLCKLKDGINNLYLLLSYDSEAFREGFYKDTGHWHICWECWAVISRFCRFRIQACDAQRQLTVLVERQTDSNLVTKSLSKLTSTLKTSYDQILINDSDITINLINSGPNIRTESEEEVPLSVLQEKSIADNANHLEGDIIISKEDKVTKPLKMLKKKTDSEPPLEKSNNGKNKPHSKKLKKKTVINTADVEMYFSTKQMSDEEMYESREKRKECAVYLNAPFKCESCIEVYKSLSGLDAHIVDVHTEEANRIPCDICLRSVKKYSLSDHIKEHYLKHECLLCDHVAYSLGEISKHLKSVHAVALKNLLVIYEKNKGQGILDKRTLFSYPCTECSMRFENKNQRWKHVQRHHREGYTCETCGKRFAFKTNLARHEQVHAGPPAREACPTCSKMVRVDLMQLHARIHTQRERFACAECDKCFVSRASYEHHLKYTQAHAAADVRKFKCSMCSKRYRSQGELKDHVNYQHMGKTQHKCPICGKGLATRRCITRHVRRAHDGVKESARDKICQQCGKAFRDKKGLREHEFIHTGERPLSCEICGCTFRQSASLYTHKKRVHKIYPPKKNVQVLESAATEATSNDANETANSAI